MSEVGLPIGWRRASLASLASYVNGFAFNDQFWSEKGLPIVRIAQITGSQPVVDRFDGQLPNQYRLDDGDLIFSWSGTLAVVRWHGGPAWLNQHLFKVEPRGDVDSNLLFHLLQRSVAEMDKRSHGSTMKHIKRGELAEYAVVLPRDLDEQAALAKVLDTLDTTIRQTEAIIEKLKQVKQGLLHDLLTRGIDANGELRPPQSEAPHLYKASPLGWIPVAWTLQEFGELCESSAFGPRFPGDAYDPNGPLATLRTTDMDNEGNIELTTMPRASIAPQCFASHLLRPGDLVISRSGTCGVSGVFDGHSIDVVPGAFLIRFRLLDKRHAQFFRRYFNSDLGRPRLNQLAVGGVQKNIKGSDILKLLVAVPPADEASAFQRAIDAQEVLLRAQQIEVAKYQELKSGLMDDLLTGRVRVTPLLTQPVTT